MVVVLYIMQYQVINVIVFNCLDAHIDIVHLLVEANANVNLIVFYLFFYFQ